MAVAVVAGLAALASAAGGMILALRTVRDQERRAAKADYQRAESELRAERDARVRLEELAFTQRMLLAHNGIVPPGEDVPGAGGGVHGGAGDAGGIGGGDVAGADPGK